MAGSLCLGHTGEDRAAAYLQALGYIILERNWRYRHWEIDIICMDGDVIVVVEVKTRQKGVEYPSELVDFQKRKNLLSAAAAYIRCKKLDREIRFDLIIVSGADLGIQHFPEAIQMFD